MDLEHVKRVAIAAAYNAGRLLRSYFGNITKIDKKGRIDLVTEADTASEALIIKTIKTVFPDHGILAEESGAHPAADQPLWIIDPLDGTTNFAHNLGLFCLSIAFSMADNIATGIILNPTSGELFAATAGKGATLNGSPICVSKTRAVSESLLATGFPYNKAEFITPLMARYTNCLNACQGVRRLGAAALDLCFLACGRFDGFWEQNLKPWDTAAGWLIAREAGAVITDFADAPFDIYKKEILATNGNIHQEMRSLLQLEDNK